MTITVDGFQDLARWAYSKSCLDWKANRRCRDKDTGDELPFPHPGCVESQRATDLLNAMRRYEGEPVLGWLIVDSDIDPDMWQ